MRSKILQSLEISSFPIEILGDSTEVYQIPGGQQAIAIWEDLSTKATEIEGWPLLLGSYSEVEFFTKNLQHSNTRAAELKQADAWKGLETHDILRASKQLELDHLLKYNREHPQSPAPEGILDILRQQLSFKPELPTFDPSDWPSNPSEEPFAIQCLFDLYENKLHEKIFLAIVGNAPPTDIAAHFNFGGWNACPPPSVHVALARLWHERYGALPLALTHDTIEYSVPHPPATPKDAWQLAWDFEAYSEEHFGCRGTKEFAQLLWNRPHWLFWWD